MRFVHSCKPSYDVPWTLRMNTVCSTGNVQRNTGTLSGSDRTVSVEPKLQKLISCNVVERWKRSIGQNEALGFRNKFERARVYKRKLATVNLTILIKSFGWWSTSYDKLKGTMMIMEILFSNTLSRNPTSWLRLSESTTTMGYYELITIAIPIP